MCFDGPFSLFPSLFFPLPWVGFLLVCNGSVGVNFPVFRAVLFLVLSPPSPLFFPLLRRVLSGIGWVITPSFLGLLSFNNLWMMGSLRMCVDGSFSLFPSLFFSLPCVGFCRYATAHLVRFSPWSKQPWLFGESAAVVAHSLLLWALGRNMHHCVGIFRLPNLCDNVPLPTGCT